MAKSKPAPTEHWKHEPDEHDYPAAESFLTLIMPPEQVTETVGALQSVSIEHWLAKDLLRASRLDLLPVDNVQVAADLKKVRKNGKLSPVLLVRGSALRNVPLIIADGYHRVCASYHLDENAPIPCRMCEAPPETS